MISVKDFAVMSWNAIWPYASEGATALFITVIGMSDIELHTKFWVATLIALAGSFFGWRYLISKTNRENAETRKQQAEARRIEIDNEERLLQNEIERAHFKTVVNVMATEELIEKLANNLNDIDSDELIKDQLKKHGIHIDKFENR